MDQGIGSWTTKRARLSGDQVAIVDRGRRFTYGEWHERCIRLARWLRAQGLRKGDRVAGVLLNGHQFLEIMYATNKLGAVFVPLNFRLAPLEVAYIVKDAGARLVFHHAEFAPLVDEALRETPLLPRVNCGAGLTATGTEPYEVLLADGGVDIEEFDVGFNDLSLMMYTSGTTGRPKGAMLSHANTTWNAVHAMGRLLLSSSDRLLTVAPMFHIGGLNGFVTTGLYAGSAIHLLPAFDPQLVLKTIAREKITAMFAVPSMWQAIVQELERERYDLSSVRLFLTGGASCPLPVLEYFHARNIDIIEGFGLTETAPFVTILDAKDATRKHGSIGVPAFHVDVRIVDDNDNDVPRGSIGELICRGPNIFLGYWNQPRASREALRGGWFHTGDLARQDEEGFYYIVDRKKDMLISGGENVYPIEVEQTLYGHPAVAEVAVIGVPDPKWQEIPRAVVVLKPNAKLTEKELIGFCEGKLAHFKTPKSIIFVDAMPRSATGKILKTELRKQFGSS